MKNLISLLCTGVFALSLTACAGAPLTVPDPCKVTCDELESSCKEKAAQNEDSTAATAADAGCEVGKDECYGKCDE
jgi:hypothetical protein